MATKDSNPSITGYSPLPRSNAVTSSSSRESIRGLSRMETFYESRAPHVCLQGAIELAECVGSRGRHRKGARAAT